jgi:hypothetical protein
MKTIPGIEPWLLGAEALGLRGTTLQSKMKMLGIKRPAT